MIIRDIQTLMNVYNIHPEHITHLLEQGIEIERMRCEVAETLNQSNHEEMIRLLQGERFLLILSSRL